MLHLRMTSTAPQHGNTLASRTKLSTKSQRSNTSFGNQSNQTTPALKRPIFHRLNLGPGHPATPMRKASPSSRGVLQCFFFFFFSPRRCQQETHTCTCIVFLEVAKLVHVDVVSRARGHSLRLVVRGTRRKPPLCAYPFEMALCPSLRLVERETKAITPLIWAPEF